MNRITVSGRLVKDPEVRYSPTGKIICRIVLAVEREYLNKDGQREADFIPIVFWEKAAEIAGNNLSKGKKILVEGKFQTRHFMNDNGEKKYTTQIIANRFEYMYSKESSDDHFIQDIPEFEGDIT